MELDEIIKIALEYAFDFFFHSSQKQLVLFEMFELISFKSLFSLKSNFSLSLKSVNLNELLVNKVCFFMHFAGNELLKYEIFLSLQQIQMWMQLKFNDFLGFSFVSFDW